MFPSLSFLMMLKKEIILLKSTGKNWISTNNMIFIQLLLSRLSQAKNQTLYFFSLMMLRVEHLHRSVGNTAILKDLHFELQEGAVVGIVGPNGCGKTSLLNAINGYVSPQTGKITFYGQEIQNRSIEKRAKSGIGRVFQSFGIFKELTVFENLALAYVHRLKWWQKLLPISSFPNAYRQEIEAILEELELLQRKNDLAGNLSGGQMRLLEIARLYLQDTKLYLLDEPTAGVAPKLKGKVISLLQKIIAQGKTVIIVEHDFEFLAQFVKEFYLMNSGKIVLQGDYQTIKESPITKEIYFGGQKG
ncbi:MAG: hypothetical protein DLD55_04850 [candidate division SR1 bacterium]|nr:MAG: hypothetical protein DLD55_04850 [candidate division SR1 bacterium]